MAVRPRRRRTAGVAVLAIIVAACASSRTVSVSSTPPARIYDNNHMCVVCEQTPCRVTISRETCFFFDSSSGYVQLRAIFPDRSSQVIIARTCELKPDEELHFECPGVNCGPTPRFYPTDVDQRPMCDLNGPLEESAARRLAAEKESRRSESISHSGKGESYGDLAFAALMLQLGAGALALAVPDYAYRFSKSSSHSGLAWELPIEWTVADGSMALGVSAAAAYFPGASQTTGKLDLRFWPIFMAGHRVDLGLAGGAFLGDGAGPRAEVRLRFHPLGAELRMLSLFVAQSYERDMRAKRDIGQLSLGIEMPITFGPVY
jgi:hypothetical protein